MQPFRFQQFSVIQNASGMRVCTDATLFGAMAPVTPGDRVLDIGAGTGLLALMAAQLGADQVVAVELTREACDEAALNFRNSPWATRLRAVHGDIRECADNLGRFDLIISNPPFFQDHSRAGDELRNTACHADTLTHRELIEHVTSCLQPAGLFHVLLPAHATEAFQAYAKGLGLQLICRTDIRGHAHNPPKVSALCFGFSALPVSRRLLTIYAAQRVYSSESAHYLAPFLLRFAPKPA